MNELLHEEIYKGYLIEIRLDDGPFDPREDENLGTIVAWHNRYNLGDMQPKQSPKEFIIDLLDEVLPASFYVPNRYDGSLQDYLGEWEENKLQGLFNKYFVNLPIFMYEHSGITIRTSQFSSIFDSGQLGFIYISKKKFLKEMQLKKWTNKLQIKAIQCLKSEVHTYDNYLTGNVFGYCIHSLNNDGNPLDLVDSCWGFYPETVNYWTHDYDYCLKEAKSYVDWKVTEDAKEQQLLDARMLNEKVENE